MSDDTNWFQRSFQLLDELEKYKSLCEELAAAAEKITSCCIVCTVCAACELKEALAKYRKEVEK